MRRQEAEDVHVPAPRRRRRREKKLLSAATLFFGAVPAAAVSADQQCVAQDTESASSCSPSPLWLDLIFPPVPGSLDDAWERSPLLSTVYKDTGRTSGLAPIPALVSPDERKRGSIHLVDNEGSSDAPIPPHQRHPQRFASLLSLFSVNDVEAVLSQPGIKHQKDFKLVRKIVRNGEEWEGILPRKELTVDEARRAFEVGGFSLVINALQRRWGPVASLTRQVQEEAGSSHVSANCYLTPDTRDNSGGRGPMEVDRDGHVARRNAFEYHWDWMDVIVLQISGTKLWSVSRAPAEYLSTRDLKTKPTLDQVDRYLSPVNETTQALSDQGRYDDFLLRPGDALYIPRGFMHNASTISPLTIEAQYGGIFKYDDDFSNFLLGGPSLHLTVGLEVAFEATYEAFVHHALAAWFASRDQDDEDAYITLASDCEGHKSKGVQWTTLLHLMVGDVTRRRKCKSGDQDVCILRRSVPRGVLWEARTSKQVKQDNRKDVLLAAIQAVVKEGNAEGASKMATQILQEQNADGNHESDYYIPVIDVHNRLTEIRCIAREFGAVLEQDVREKWHLFEQFVRATPLVDIIDPFEKHLRELLR